MLAGFTGRDDRSSERCQRPKGMASGRREPPVLLTRGTGSVHLLETRWSRRITGSLRIRLARTTLSNAARVALGGAVHRIEQGTTKRKRTTKQVEDRLLDPRYRPHPQSVPAV